MRRTAHLSAETMNTTSEGGEPSRDGALSFTELLDGMADELQRRTKDARAGVLGRRPRGRRPESDAEAPPASRPAEQKPSSPSDDVIAAARPGPAPSAKDADKADVSGADAPETRSGSDAALNEAIALVSQRLDDLNRKMVEGRQPTATKSDDTLEAASPVELDPAPASLLAPAPAPAAEAVPEEQPKAQDPVDDVLRGFEDRIAQAGARAARPARGAGRRGLDRVEEIRSAVVSIRAKQRELDEAEPAPAGPVPRPVLQAPVLQAAPRSQNEVVASVKAEVVRLAGQLDALQTAPPAQNESLNALLVEVGRMQERLGGLATRREVGAVETAVREIGKRLPAHGSARGQEGGLPVEDIRSEVDRLSSDISANVHGRITRDLDRLARKMDAVAGLAQSAHAIETVSRQLPEMNRRLDELADLRRMADVVDRVSEISQATVQGDDAGALRPLLEEVKAGLERSHSAAAQVGPDISRQIALLGERIEDLRRHVGTGDVTALGHRMDALTRAVEASRATPAALVDKVDALSSKMDLAASTPADLTFALDRLFDRVDGALARGESDGALGTVLARLDRIDARLRRKPGDPNSIEEMLRSLADNLEAAENPASEAAALDALEKQVGSISMHLRGAKRDPALSSLERAMGDLMAQVTTMRDADDVGPGAETPLLGTEVERELSDLRAHRTAQDERLQAMLSGVHSAIENLANRFAAFEGATGQVSEPAPAAPAPNSPRSKADARLVRASAPTATATAEAADVKPAEVLIEPGAGRPKPNGQRSERESRAETGVPDVKANFIAAARRAAQAAAVEAGQRRTGPRPEATASRKTDEAGVGSRLSRVFAPRRRHAVLGLAAAVLALGALQSKTGLVTEKLASWTSTQPQDKPKPGSGAVDQDVRVAEIAPSPASTAQAAKVAPPPIEIAAPREPASVAVAPMASPAPAQEAKVDAVPPAPAAPVADQASKPAPAVTGSIEPAKPRAPTVRVPNVASVGEIPTVSEAPGLRQAALAGDGVAVFELASRAAEGRGMPRDPKLAAKLFEKAAANGVVPAQYRIGNQYEKGIGVPRDLGLAKLWYQKAADNGNAKAMHNLAVLLAEGGGASPDYTAAASWFKAAAERGIRDSQYNLAVLYTRGLGLKQDLLQSYVWFAVAASAGDDDAGKKRDEVGQRLSAKDMASAKEVMERWRAQPLDQAANEIVLPPGGWPDLSAKRGPAPKKA